MCTSGWAPRVVLVLHVTCSDCPSATAQEPCCLCGQNPDVVLSCRQAMLLSSGNKSRSPILQRVLTCLRIVFKNTQL